MQVQSIYTVDDDRRLLITLDVQLCAQRDGRLGVKDGRADLSASADVWQVTASGGVVYSDSVDVGRINVGMDDRLRRAYYLAISTQLIVTENNLAFYPDGTGMSARQKVVMLRGWGMACRYGPFHLWMNVWVTDKTVSLRRTTLEHNTGQNETLIIKRYTYTQFMYLAYF